MSVILYEKTKFNQIYAEIMKYEVMPESLSCSSEQGALYRSLDLDPFKEAHKLSYLAKTLCEDLYIANQMAWNRQYEDDQKAVECLSVKKNKGFENKCAFLKALRAIRYNIYDNGGEVSKFEASIKRLECLIVTVTDLIIDGLTDYQKAEW